MLGRPLLRFHLLHERACLFLRLPHFRPEPLDIFLLLFLVSLELFDQQSDLFVLLSNLSGSLPLRLLKLCNVVVFLIVLSLLDFLFLLDGVDFDLYHLEDLALLLELGLQVVAQRHQLLNLLILLLRPLQQILVLLAIVPL